MDLSNGTFFLPESHQLKHWQISSVWEAISIGLFFPKHFVPILIGNHIFWAGWLNFSKWIQLNNSLHPLISWLAVLWTYLKFFTHNALLVVSRRPFRNMFEGIIPLISCRLVNELSKMKSSSIHKTLILLYPPRTNQYLQVTQFNHSKYNVYPQRKWLIDNAKVSTTTVMKSMSRAITTVNKISFIWMSIPPQKWKT